MAIEVTHYKGVHQGGTKDYSLYLLFSEDTKRAILVKSWGKVGAVGQMKHEICTGTGDKELSAALVERNRKGYDMRMESSSKVNTAEEALNLHFSKSQQRSFYGNQLALIDPNRFQISDRSAYDPMRSERDALIAKTQREAEIEERKQAEIDRAAETNELQSNPLFGMF